jgi:hypothetical protein
LMPEAAPFSAPFWAIVQTPYKLALAMDERLRAGAVMPSRGKADHLPRGREEFLSLSAVSRRP